MAVAAELADDPLERARLLERAGHRARAADRLDVSETLLREAHALTEAAGATHDRARVAAALGLTVWQRGRLEEAIALMEDAFAVLSGDELDPDVATLAAQLGRLHHFAGDPERAAARIEVALDIAEELRLPEVIASALNTKSLIVRNHLYESDALLRQALRIALDNDLVFEALRAYNNLVVLVTSHDRDEEALALLHESLALARRRGDRFWETRLTIGLCEDERLRGEWDAALERTEELPVSEAAADAVLASVVAGLTRIRIERGDDAVARTLLAKLPTDTSTADVQMRGIALWRRYVEAELDERYDKAIAGVDESIVDAADLLPAQVIAELLHDAARYATLGGDHTAGLRVAEKVDALPATMRVRSVNAQLYRVRANAAAASGRDDEAADAYAIALANARNLGYAYWLAPVLADYGTWLVASGRDDDAAPLVAEARQLFEAMGAVLSLRRLDAVAPAATTRG